MKIFSFLEEKICTFKFNFCFIKFAENFGVHFEQKPQQKVRKKKKILSQKFYNITISINLMIFI